MKVLVVDDDAETRIQVSDFLSRLQVDHATLATAGECLARLVSNPHEFALIILDIHMPGVSGLDISTWIKGSEIDPLRKIPIIALTADEAYHEEARIAQFGMDGVLGKPVTIERLNDTLRRYSVAAIRH